MFKTHFMTPLLDSLVVQSLDFSRPPPLAASFLSGKDGSPLMTSLSVPHPFGINFDISGLGDPLYGPYLDQFTNLDYSQMTAKKIQEHQELEQEQLEIADNNSRIPNYGSTITQQPSNLSMGYTNTKTDFEAYHDQLSMTFSTMNRGNEGNISDAIETTHATLSLVAHYVFTCYTTFKTDYLRQEAMNGKKPLEIEENLENNSNGKKSRKKHKEREDAELKIKKWTQGTPLEQLNGPRWFNMELDGKNIMLYLIFNSKTGDEYFIMLVTKIGYPKGLAKLKLQKFEQVLQNHGF